MDVVGPNHEMLLALYDAHQAHLLEYERPSMVKTFGKFPRLRWVPGLSNAPPKI